MQQPFLNVLCLMYVVRNVSESDSVIRTRVQIYVDMPLFLPPIIQRKSSKSVLIVEKNTNQLDHSLYPRVVYHLLYVS